MMDVSIKKIRKCKSTNSFSYHDLKTETENFKIPLLIQGFTTDIKATNLWKNPVYISKKLASSKLKIEIFSNHEWRIESRQYSSLKFDEFYQLFIKKTSSHHPEVAIMAHPMTGISSRHGLTKLYKDIKWPDFFDVPRFHQDVIFCGFNTMTFCHYHYFRHALAFQSVGKKRFLLFAPEDTPNLYPFSWYKKWFNMSSLCFKFNSRYINLKKYPLFDKVKIYDITLQPGDVLYIPPYWWHVVFGLKFSVTVTRFWHATFFERFMNPMAIRYKYSKKADYLK